eukprot:TRINITY_DN68024_c0_g1_i1.p1 TRINITY_DN68024_c0_g1~~TRINITY_DN68024_c0_g1_i1.p1  ORF type:complete len:179 (-),score=32.83 TRINITY_DN68024_c0_g1_i1:275-811(-)
MNKLASYKLPCPAWVGPVGNARPAASCRRATESEAAEVQEEVLVLCKFPDLDASEFFTTSDTFTLTDFDTAQPRLVVDGKFRFVGSHAQICGTHLVIGADTNAENELFGLAKHEAVFDIEPPTIPFGASTRPDKGHVSVAEDLPGRPSGGSDGSRGKTLEKCEDGGKGADSAKRRKVA